MRKLNTRLVAAALSLGLTFSGMPINAYAKQAGPEESRESGYTMVWNDEFNGDELNLEDWNVEARPKGWVNSELQVYPGVTYDDQTGEAIVPENIQVSDGILSIHPKATKKESGGVVSGDVFDGNSFDGNWGTTIANWGGEGETADADISFQNGNATVGINDPGSLSWHVQVQRAGLTLEKGHEYTFSFKAKSDVAKKMQFCVTNTTTFIPYEASTVTIGTTEEEYSITFTMGDCQNGEVATQINLGKFDGTAEGSAAANVELSDVKLVDNTEAGSASNVQEVALIDGFVAGEEGGWTSLVANWDDSVHADATINVNDGSAEIAIVDSGDDSWHVQLQKAGLTIEEGHKYRFTAKASSTVKRKASVLVQDLNEKNQYYGFGRIDSEIGPDETDLSFDFTAECSTSEATLQFNLGWMGSADDSAAATVTFTDVKLVDLTATEALANTQASGDTFSVNNYNFTSGRINTQGKNDFTYGYFECRAKVPSGKGYLPAFWLMASDESNYGQWPKCGEMDIMETVGDDTDVSYHTLHYGYDADSGRQSQGTKKIENKENDFHNEYHVFGFEWLPDELIWYVDGEKVYSESYWFTGSDDDDQLTYPAPFDQDFYVILNLAVGGDWPKNPDQAAVEDMDNQSFDIDYVRVYQLDEDTYKEMEENAERPVLVEKIREADDDGNFVVNGDFTKGIKASGSDEDNWELYLLGENSATTYSLSDDGITINPSTVGTASHSVQLKQNGIPMRKGCEYEITFDAYAEEAREILVNVEGGEKTNWKRYFGDQTVELTKKNAGSNSYSFRFTMEEKTNVNSIVEFNLGAQGSTSPVTISNVKIKQVGGEEIAEDTSKKIRPDGNYVYNGSFDQGDKRLGYWDVDEDDKANVSVTNDNGVRELSVKVEVPEGASEANPVVVSQSDLAEIGAGQYLFSFDAYTPDGAADGVKATACGKTFTPELGAEKESFGFVLDFTKTVKSEDAGVKFEFTKPGTYYLDNVAFRENAMIKNGYFESGLTGYTTGCYEGGDATFAVDSIMEGNDTALAVDIKSVGDKDYSVQIKQDRVKLEKGKTYRLKYDARSTVDRTISVCMQKNGGDWAVYSGEDKEIALTSEWQTFTKEFEMTDETDESALFSVALGKFGDIEAGVEHSVYMDNITLVEVTDEENGNGNGNGLGDGKDDDVVNNNNNTTSGNKSDNKSENKSDNKSDKKTDDKKADDKKSDDTEKAAKPSNEWVDGKWYNEDGTQDYTAKAIWKNDANGWWLEDENGWYPKSQWQKIDGKWYYFTADGYMDYSEYRDGCWLGSDGAWVEDYYGGQWMHGASGWWYMDASGWFPTNQYLWIDGVQYWFDANGITN